MTCFFYLSLDVVYVRIKRKRQVPVLINAEEIKAIEVLIEFREVVGVDPKNIWSQLTEELDDMSDVIWD